MTDRDVDGDLQRLEAELKQLEAEYNMFFAGRLPRPPWETRARVEAIIKRYDQRPPQNYGVRFRFTTLQTRFAKFAELWDSGQRAREEGRAGPFAQPPRPESSGQARAPHKVVHVAAFHDPLRERDKLGELYESLNAARRETGAPQVPFDKFASLVKSQVERMRAQGGQEVAFRVSVKDGKVNLTARTLKEASKDGGE